MPLTQQTQATSESHRILTVLKLNVTLPDVVTQGSLSLSHRATKAMESIMKERQKRSQHRSISTSKQKNTTSKSLIEPR